MAKKSPRTKITDILGQADLDAQAKKSLGKSGGKQRSHSVKNTRQAEKAELESYKLNRKARF